MFVSLLEVISSTSKEIQKKWYPNYGTSPSLNVCYVLCPCRCTPRMVEGAINIRKMGFLCYLRANIQEHVMVITYEAQMISKKLKNNNNRVNIAEKMF